MTKNNPLPLQVRERIAEVERLERELEAVTAERDRLRERLAELGEVDLREAK